MPRYRLPNEIEVRQAGYVSQFLWLTSDGVTQLEYRLESLETLESDRARRRARRQRSSAARPTALTAPIDTVLEERPSESAEPTVEPAQEIREAAPTGLDPID